jgi:hypothetical protein
MKVVGEIVAVLLTLGIILFRVTSNTSELRCPCKERWL